MGPRQMIGQDTPPSTKQAEPVAVSNSTQSHPTIPENHVGKSAAMTVKSLFTGVNIRCNFTLTTHYGKEQSITEFNKIA